MPSDSVSSFLDHARDARLLPPDQVDDLARQPDVPHDSLAALTDYLLANSKITPFQADRIRTGRGNELTFAGYALTDELGPCPGGTAYRGLHPSLRTPLVVRRLRADWFAPADNFAAFIGRARDACPVTHPHLAHLLDAGVYQDEPFVVLDPFDGTNLETLVRDIGPMPTGLACDFARQAAAGLAAAHDRGLAHGDVRAAHIHVGPLVASSRNRPDGTPFRRPATDAAATVFELGLVPRRPGAADPTPAGDARGLGAALYFLLAGRAGGSGPLDLKPVRPDVPDELAVLVREMTAADPAARPPMAAVADRLAAFGAPLAPPPPPAADPETSDVMGSVAPLSAAPPEEELAPLTPAAEPDPVPLTAADGPAAPSDEWTATPYTGPDQSGSLVFAVEAATAPPSAADSGVPSDLFGPSSGVNRGAPAARPKKAMTEADRAKVRMWFMVGAGLWLLTIPLWIIFLNQSGCFGGSAKQQQQPPSGPKQYRDKPR